MPHSINLMDTGIIIAFETLLLVLIISMKIDDDTAIELEWTVSYEI
jgi:hypothetical protein